MSAASASRTVRVNCVSAHDPSVLSTAEQFNGGVEDLPIGVTVTDHPRYTSPGKEFSCLLDIGDWIVGAQSNPNKVMILPNESFRILYTVLANPVETLDDELFDNISSNEKPVDITDTKLISFWLLDNRYAHSIIDVLDTAAQPYSCEYCPWKAKTVQPYHEIANDPSEAHYRCPVVNEKVWGENPKCGGHIKSLLLKILEKEAGWEEHLKSQKAEEERQMEVKRRQDALRQSALSKLTADEKSALGI